MKYTKKDITNVVIENTELSKVTAANLVEDLIEFLKDCIISGDSIEIRDFGTFKPQLIKARKAQDMKHGGTIDLPEIVKPKFKPSRSFISACNNK